MKAFIKEYRLSIVIAALLHSWIFFISNKSDSIEVELDNLIEVQLLNEELPPKVVTPPKTAPPPPPIKKTKPKEIPKEITPEPEAIAEEEVIVKEVTQPKEVVAPKVPVEKTKPLVKATPGPTVVDSKNLDNKNFKPFGNKKPSYPSLARKSGIEGWVKVKVLVDKKGKVIQAKVIDFMGHPSFKASTLAVAKRWRFPAPTVKGKRIQAWYVKKVGFKLRD